MRRFLKRNGLSVAMFAFFLGTLIPMTITGHRAYNSYLHDHQRSALSYWNYLGSGNFVEGVFENWESEFLQMGSYVVLTAMLFQKGSPESKPLDEETPQDQDPRRARNPDRPWPVRRGGLLLRLYENSLAIVLFLFFLLSFALHAIGGVSDFNADQLLHGGHPISMWRFLTTADFWFQSLQNWQSEFLSVGMLAVLGIWLRQRGSPESKPVAAAHEATGG